MPDRWLKNVWRRLHVANVAAVLSGHGEIESDEVLAIQDLRYFATREPVRIQNRRRLIIKGCFSNLPS